MLSASSEAKPQPELPIAKNPPKKIASFDHRFLGQHQNLFFTAAEEIGPGLPFFQPNGTILRQELELLSTEEQRKAGYLTVSTPILAKEKTYQKSGHLPYYSATMFSAINIEGEAYRLRPMNCPHHHQIYLSKKRSFQELPLRIAEQGRVFRYEPRGSLTGLLRTREFSQNDAHIYVRHDQAKQIFVEVMQLHQKYYQLFEIKDFYMRLSLPDTDNPKYIDDPRAWSESIEIIRAAMRESGLPFREVKDEAAFYGPKIDFQATNTLGNEYTISTNQLDFAAAARFDLTYTDEMGANKPVYVIHRAPLGSHERFIAFLTEHYQGKFPTWLAPVQIRILPINASNNDYANKIKDWLFNAKVHTATGGLRVEVDLSKVSISKKIRHAHEDHIPYTLIIGAKEQAAGMAMVRLRNMQQIAISLDDFLARIHYEIAHRLDFTSTLHPEILADRQINFKEFYHAPLDEEAAKLQEIVNFI